MNKLYDDVIHFVSTCIMSSQEHYYRKILEFITEKEDSYLFSDWQTTIRLPVDLEYFAYEMIREAKVNDITSKELKQFLEISYKMAKSQLESQPKIFPVWTGPSIENGTIKLKTYETVKHLIESAESEVFIVGYTFSFKHPSIQELLKSIESAIERKCRVNIIVNEVEKNLSEIMKYWKMEKHHLNIYNWIGGEEEKYTSLHSKLIIIDQQKLLLTSANFSYHGFKKNIETGVVIEDRQISKDIWNQYHMLMKDKQMRKAF